MSVLWALRGDVISEALEEFLANRGMLFLSGLLALVVGIAMVISHSIWELNWRGLITLMGYLSVLKGIARIGFPDVSMKAANSLLKGGITWILIGFAFLLGCYLTWAGFTKS